MAINKKKNDFTRFSILKGIVAGLFTVLILRVTYLQVFRYDDFKEKADTRSMRFMAEKAPRGKIYDSNGNILATNKQTYIATFVETESSKEAFYRTMETLFTIMDENEQEIIDKFDLKVTKNNQLAFDFGFNSEENNKAAELRFKRDKGILDEVQKELYPKQKTDLTDEQIDKIEKEAQKITADQTFYYLVSKYEMAELLSAYKDIDTNLSEDEQNVIKKGIKDKYKNPDNKSFKSKIEEGKKIVVDLLKEKSLSDIRRFMVVKDAIQMQSFSGFKPVTIAPSISKDAAFVLYQKLNSLKGIEISLEPVRFYPYGNLGSHVLGYMGSIPGASKEKYESRDYDLSTDLIGMSGIESAYESVLRGTKGGDMVKVNAEGRKRESLYKMQTTPGNNVHLTIDKDIQYSAEKMLETQIKHLQSKSDTKNASRGAAVAIDVNTGDVLAMASYPSYDPNIFATGKIDGDVAKDLVTPDLDKFGADYISRSGIRKTVDELFPRDKEGIRQDPNDIYPKPMFNYATMGLIPPGSTFKPVTALIALEEGVMGASETINDSSVLGPGLTFIKYRDLIDTPKDNANHGVVSLREAIQRSCNSYFYEVAVRLYRKYDNSVEGLDSIAKYSWQLGLSKDPKNPDANNGTGIEIAERVGTVYNFEGSKDKFKTFSMWDLVSGLKKGQLNSGGQSFIPVDIEKSEKDSKSLKEAKEEFKTLVKDEIEKITSLNNTGLEKEFKEKIQKSLKKIYDNSPLYQDNIKNKKSDLKVHFEVVSTEVWNWIQYNVKYQIVNPGNLASAAIGQGDTNLTPLQMASAMATISNGGTRYDVNLIDKITTSTGDLVKDIEPSVRGKFDVSQENIDILKEGMYMTNHKPTGTGMVVFDGFPIATGGKTGTATLKDDQAEYGRNPYGVYVAFAPIEKPEIAVCVTIYDGESGGNSAIVARAIFETYFREQIKEIAPNYSPRTRAGDEYSYTLYPESMDFKDDGIFVREKQELEEGDKEFNAEINLIQPEN